MEGRTFLLLCVFVRDLFNFNLIEVAIRIPEEAMAWSRAEGQQDPIFALAESGKVREEPDPQNATDPPSASSGAR